MSDHKIEIKKSVCNDLQPSQSYLVLDDGGLSVARPNDEVIWFIDPKNKDTKKITSFLIEDDKTTNLFVPDPAPVDGNFKEWKGTIRGNLAAGAEEKYKIYWSENGVVYSYDPKIQINS